MWRFIHGISRGLRTKTPVPPSQTASRNDDSDNKSFPNLGVTPQLGIEDEEASECHTPGNSIQVTLSPTPIFQQNISSTAQSDNVFKTRPIDKPSDADILLREVFGTSWKNSKAGSSSGYNRSDFSQTEIIQTGFTLGTAWISVLVLGREIFSKWRGKCRRRRICENNDRLPSLQDYEQKYIRQLQEDFFKIATIPTRPSRTWLPRLGILPSTLSPSAVLASGRISNSFPDTVSATPLSGQAPSTSARRELGSPAFSNQKFEKPLNKTKSVTFERGVLDGLLVQDPSDTSSPSHENSISEAALEQFTEETRDCSGAAFNILGLQCAHSGDYKQALECFTLGSSEGHGKSLFNLALCYQKGLGTKKNMAKAMDCYEKAAFKGHNFAQYNLALLLLEKGDLTNKIQAIRLLEKAALSGFTKAQSYLGVFYTKEGDFQNFKKAVKMFKLAAEEGDASAKYHLGICYEKGLGGLKKDLSSAFDLYSSAATSEHLDAQYNMAALLETGFPGVEKNTKLARELFESAAKSGHKPSISHLKEFKSKKSKSLLITKHKSSQAESDKNVTVYYSSGTPRPLRPVDSVCQPYHNVKETDMASHSEKNTKDDKQTLTMNPRQINMPDVTDLLSFQISKLGMMNGTHSGLSHYKSFFGTDVNTPIFNPHLNPSSDMSILFPQSPLNTPSQHLRRSSTSPANLCFHAPLVQEPTSALSLEV